MLKEPEFKKVKFGQIKPWEKNPRNIKKEKLERLAKSIKEKGLFQTLTCWKEGSFYVTGGGNMRWHAMKHILKWPEEREVWISLNFPENEKEKIELSLLDNMRFGQYIEQELAELVYPYIEEIELEDYSIDLTEPWMDLKQVVERVGPDIDPNQEWQGMPEFSDRGEAVKSLIVHFKTEEDIKRFSELVEQEITEKTKYIWFPERKRQNYKDEVYIDAS